MIYVELFKIELLLVNKWLRFNWIVSDTLLYLELFNFVVLCLQIIYI